MATGTSCENMELQKSLDPPFRAPTVAAQYDTSFATPRLV